MAKKTFIIMFQTSQWVTNRDFNRVVRYMEEVLEIDKIEDIKYYELVGVP